MTQPEDKARENIDRMLTKAGWAVRDQGDANISAHRGLAIRNFSLKPGHGFADYLLYVDSRAAGVIEANVRSYFCSFIRASSGRPSGNWKIEMTYTVPGNSLAGHKELAEELGELERRIACHGEQIRVIFEASRQLMAPPLSSFLPWYCE